ncbi:TetR/AcrR family transcriptional regulator [Cellulomonas algicola]|uniref:TetR/AcrR family transcriptional regulator n=1 Tax=Cellulomonas algicola TaxID=2071633 RepID=UPI000F5817E2|nr:TetR family transcriptional regulator [Cellulomonas algicola]
MQSAPDVDPGAEPAQTPRPRGRRPAGEDTRGAIVAAARAEFAEKGFDAASVRSVARRAGVDPALVRHYFGDKASLFAAGVIPQGVDPGRTAAAMVAGGLDGLGERLLRTVVGVWDSDGGATFRAVFSALGSDGVPPHVIMGYVGREVFAQVSRVLPGPDPAVRVSLVASHVVGVLVARHVLGVEPLASLDVDRLASLVGPTLQRYMTDPLPDTST